MRHVHHHAWNTSAHWIACCHAEGEGDGGEGKCFAGLTGWGGANRGCCSRGVDVGHLVDVVDHVIGDAVPRVDVVDLIDVACTCTDVSRDSGDYTCTAMSGRDSRQAHDLNLGQPPADVAVMSQAAPSL